MFESNGLLDLPSPPSLDTASSTGPGSTTHLETPIDIEGDRDMELDFGDDGGISTVQRERNIEYDGPDEWEEEMLAMQEMEAEEELARNTATLAASVSMNKGKGKARVGTVSEVQAGFGESDLFESLDDLDEPGPSTGARRTRLSSMDLNIGEEAYGSGPEGAPSALPAPQQSTKTTATASISLSTAGQRAPVEKCYLPALRSETASGRLLYIKRRYKPTPRPLPEAPTTTGANLLSQPLAALLREVQSLRDHQQAQEMSDLYAAERETALLRNRAARIHATTTTDDTVMDSDDMEAYRKRKKKALEEIKKGKQMWVDKYRPKRFADLLGEDRVHRDVLNWLKEWDQCVFKRTLPGKKRKLESEEANAYTDPLGRPRDRILLLSGPPGFGKTTLAQILARQAGYRTLEINASDDRNAATVGMRIKNAIEAGSAIDLGGCKDDGGGGGGGGGGKRPTCVVVDEIDGATGGGDQSFIKSLIKLIQDVPANRKRNIPARPLRRPIICICNDLYAPALRPLRPFARVIRFRKPASQLLVKRLQDICSAENLSADLRSLTTLVDLTGGDVRSCLNTLQFIKSKTNTVTDQAIRSLAVGLKDSSTSLHSAWHSLFVPLPAKVRRKQAGLAAKDSDVQLQSLPSTTGSGSGSTSNSTSNAGVDDGKFISRLHSAISTCGDLDRLVQGAFEHYPNLKPIDGSWSNYCRLLDGPLHFYDAANKRISEGGEYEMMGYMGYSVVSWYGLAGAANTTRAVEWPKADYEAYVTRSTNLEVATTFAQTIPPILRSMFCGSAVAVELVPYLMRIISPPLKPVNANIVKPAEKALLSRLVELMIPLNLSFWVEKTESGQPMMRLEPAIDCFVHYEGKRAEDMAAGRFAVRQLIAQAIDAEKAHRRGTGGTAEDAKSSADSLKGMYGAAKKTGKVDAAAVKEVVATDFFGRQIVKKAKVDKGAGGGSTTDGTSMEVDVDEPVPEAIVKFRAVYKFHEGSSAAVRRGVKMSTLM